MRRLVIALVVLALVALVADLAADRVAENLIADTVEERAGAREAEASIDSFPLLPRVLLSEEVSRLTVTMNGVDAGTLEMETLTADLRDLELSLGRLSQGLEGVEGIGRGVLSATITKASIERAAGESLPASDVTARASNGSLTLSAPDGPPLEIGFEADVLPCPAAGRLIGDRLRLRCTIERVPPGFLN